MIKALRRIGLFVIHKKLKRRMQVEIIPNEKEKFLQINELEFDNNLEYQDSNIIYLRSLVNRDK